MVQYTAFLDILLICMLIGPDGLKRLGYKTVSLIKNMFVGVFALLMKIITYGRYKLPPNPREYLERPILRDRKHGILWSK